MPPGNSLTKKVTIDRARWLVPTSCPHDDGVLLDRTGFRCCLGFLGEACGVTDEEMRGKPLPADGPNLPAWPGELFKTTPVSKSDGKDDTWATVLAAVNDATNIDDTDREQAIIVGFREVLGFGVEFVGSYPAPRPQNVCPCSAILEQGQPMAECEDCGGTGRLPEDDGWGDEP